MQRKIKQISVEYEKIDSSMVSYLPVNRNGWFIKFSVYNGYNILLVFTSMFTGQTILRYYDNEDEAVKFINYIIECDPTEEIPQ
jgi:hypothetical protein